jgi:hypothetical protein
MKVYIESLGILNAVAILCGTPIGFGFGVLIYLALKPRPKPGKAAQTAEHTTNGGRLPLYPAGEYRDYEYRPTEPNIRGYEDKDSPEDFNEYGQPKLGSRLYARRSIYGDYKRDDGSFAHPDLETARLRGDSPEKIESLRVEIMKRREDG